MIAVQKKQETHGIQKKQETHGMQKKQEADIRDERDIKKKDEKSFSVLAPKPQSIFNL